MEIAARLPCDIVSVDSAMVYRGMDIGTAKPDAATLARSPHRLINILDPAEAYSAARFREDALREIGDIHRSGRIPLLVGGTMLYFRALAQGLSDLPAAQPELRSRIAAEAGELGWDGMHQQLVARDPETASRIHPNDAQRIQRALEIIELTGNIPSALYRDTAVAAPAWPVHRLVLAPTSRAELHERVELRFRQMMANGFLDEVAHLRDRGDLNLDKPSMRAVGYRQLWMHLDGSLPFQEAVEKGISASRQLAKRQLTWLRRETADAWLKTGSPGLGRQALELLQRAGVNA